MEMSQGVTDSEEPTTTPSETKSITTKTEWA